MCGRYVSFLPPDFLAQLFEARNPPPNFELTWNMLPAATRLWCGFMRPRVSDTSMP
jgi:hypothetical protein